ncbi:Cof-type HAD-IIB family hydrolase [Paenibacillus sp. N3.4]|uniref:Cof-type HAD-IIB family hydrolase n=1 Tax=Paenibacillus sp. N3.4 TaxID=2603222 RepID=UPI0011CC635C|nr:HAD family hydrolase [Paenibacillus sp. N3.4]TXK77405.1 HAD family phosphatase [Paenibacillus sp. N3.4]
MSRIKLIALDLDGTLLNEDSQVSEENRKAIAEARSQGVTVIVATGREVQTAKPYWQELSLESPMVTVNGSEVWKSSGELHMRQMLNIGTVMALHKIAIDEDCWFYGYTTEGMIDGDNWSRTTPESQWLKFCYSSENRNQLERVRAKAEEVGLFEITNSHSSNIELNPWGISKASGIREVCDLLALSMEEVMAVGDSLNDKAMLLEAGIGVAMGNAQDEVKQLANAVTGSNREDGVAQAIRRYVLEADK